MTSPDPSRYADGRLSPAARRAFDPPPPSEAEWKRVSDAVALRVLRKAGPRRAWVAWTAAALAGCAIAATVFVALLSGGKPLPNQAPQVVRLPEVVVAPAPREVRDPLADFAVLPVASADEVTISLVRGERPTGFVNAAHPLPDVLQIATADEVVLERVPRGMESSPVFGDLPMILELQAKTGIE